MDFEYDKIDISHAEILEKVAVLNRSGKNGFKEGKTDRLDAIRELLKDSGYTEILLPHAQIWRKNMAAPIDMIVSSHADVVDSISKCFSTLTENGYLIGTYDNAGTNGAAVIAMLEGNIPDNVIFAFTADEETGRCNGAKQVLEYARNQGYEPICMALDVTWEGYDDGNLFSVENLSSGHKKNEDVSFLNRVAQAAMNMETEDFRSFSMVRINKDTKPTIIPEQYIAKDTGMFDEAFAYIKEHAKAFSLCLPCDGSMHGNHGVTVRQPGFEGYVNALKTMCYQLSLSEEKDMADSIPESIKIENNVLLQRICGLIKEEVEKEKQRRAAYYSEGPYSSYVYGSDCWDDYSYFGYAENDPLSLIIDTLYEGCVDYGIKEKDEYIEAAMEYIEGVEDDDGNNLILEKYSKDSIVSILSGIFDEYHDINDDEEYDIQDEDEFDASFAYRHLKDEPDDDWEDDIEEEDTSFYAVQKRIDQNEDYIAYDVPDDFDEFGIDEV